MSGVQISLPRPIFDFLIDNRSMVTVAQLVEPRTVTPVVAGSNPVSHPIFVLQISPRLNSDST